MTRFTLAEVRERTYKPRDAWWTVFLVDPLAGRLVVWTANRTGITPNQLTFGAGVLGAASAVCFALADWQWLVLGALLFHLSFVLDCMDGKIARLKGNGSVFGAWVDFVFDRIRFFACVMALLIGQWVATGEVVYLILAPVVVFLDLLRYLNGAQVGKTRAAMRNRLAEAAGVLDTVALGAAAGADPENIGEEDGEAGEQERPRDAAAARERGLYPRVRDFLLRHRVRPHLFSGIEFEMFLCVVAPLTVLVSLVSGLPSLIVPVAVLSCAALLLFEVVLVYRLWKNTKHYERRLRELSAAHSPGRFSPGSS